MTPANLEDAEQVADLLADRCKCATCSSAIALLRQIPELRKQLSELQAELGVTRLTQAQLIRALSDAVKIVGEYATEFEDVTAWRRCADIALEAAKP